MKTVDEDHSEIGAEQDLLAVVPRLKVGGLLVFDDTHYPAPLYLAKVWEKVVGDDTRFTIWKFQWGSVVHKEKRVLITGAHGFLGRYISLFFKKKGLRVIGVGHGHWDFERPSQYGIDQWIEARIDFPALNSIEGDIHYVVHCAGGSSVGYSVQHPLEDFERTVSSSIAILEYLRISHPRARFIYPSSAAVYGNIEDVQIDEQFETNPISPYGYYKRIVEQLCFSYANNYNMNVTVIRFFSIYGEGLKKQLLWDACCKISKNVGAAVEFFGTGQETRDWIHGHDAARLIYATLSSSKNKLIVNGGGGERITNKELIRIVADAISKETQLDFIGQCKEGDPKYYWADISEARKIGWEPQVLLSSGVRNYVEWYKQNAAN